MDLQTIIIAIGAFCGALVTAGGVGKWLVTSAITDLLKEVEKERQAEAIAKTKRDGEIDTKFATIAQSLEATTLALEKETKERHQWEADLERRKQHTKANHEQKLGAMDRRIEASSLAVEANTRRIIALEEANKNMISGIIRVEEAVKASAAVAKTQFDQVCESIREMSKRDIK